MTRTKLTLSIGAALVAAQPLLAQDSQLGGGLGFSVFRAFLALIFVLALFFLFVYAVRRWYPQAISRFPGSPASRPGQIEIRTVKVLGPKRALYLVQVDDREYLLAATDQQVTKLDQWAVAADDRSQQDGDTQPDTPSDGRL